MHDALPDYAIWHYVDCMEADDGNPSGDNEILVKFLCLSGGSDAVFTLNYSDYADKPALQTLESRLNIAEWQVAGLEKIIKELKDRLTKLENGV
jgi:hypothetical protein